jgi:hypothetical protein
LKTFRFYIAKILTFLVAFQILSLGLFVQDFEAMATSAVSPEVNIINTIDEFIAEVVLQHQNAVPEPKEHSKKDIQIHKHADYKVNEIIRPSVTPVTPTSSSTTLSSFTEQYDYQFFEDIIPPPPKNA